MTSPLEPKNTVNEEMINNPDPSRLIHGLRDTGYDVYTAAADIIDNSIAAYAENIRIKLDLTADGRKFVYFGDDGHGMDQGELRNAMRYGAEIRENLSSLGKFGLGLKTASSSVCLKYALISRKHAVDPLLKLTWDLQHVHDVGRWEMLDEPISVDEEEVFAELCGEKGTLVIWSRCDRLLSKYYDEPGGSLEKRALNNRIAKLKDHCALVFHKFLNPEEAKHPNVKLVINDDPVQHWNPFYPERSEQMLKQSMTSLSIQLSNGAVHNATVKAWILPHSKDLNDEEKSLAKITSRGQGFYIHRQGRLIHHGGYLGIWRSDDPHWSLFRIEFDFDHELDEAFSVDVKKSRILLDPSLEEGLKELLDPAYREADLRYRRKQKVKIQGGVDHKSANKTIEETKNTTKVVSEETSAEEGVAILTNNKGKGIKILTPIENNVEKDKLYVRPVDNLSGGALWEPFLTSATEDNHTTGVHLNKDHDFYSKIYSRANDGISVEGLDLLLWALAAAEHRNTDQELQYMWEDIREEVSSNLKKLLRSIDMPTD
jgi:hypothetical protein